MKRKSPRIYQSYSPSVLPKIVDVLDAVVYRL